MKSYQFIALSLISLFYTSAIYAQKHSVVKGFMENKGQIVNQKGIPADNVYYLLNSSGLNVQLHRTGFSYDIFEEKPQKSKTSKPVKPSDFNLNTTESTPKEKVEYSFHRIDVTFLGMNLDFKMIPQQMSKDHDNYYNVPGKKHGISIIHNFGQVTYKNIYPNIDVVFVAADSLKVVEYNFIIHPGGDISDIQMKFSGVETALFQNKIKMKVRFGELEETLPASWTENGNLKEPVAINYRQIGKNVYGFNSSQNISDKTTVIDPVPIRLWGTYYCGENRSAGETITIDKNNDVYISGATSSFTNIATTGTHLSTYIGTQNSFIAKIDPDGARIWGTYYAVTARKIAIDNNFNVIFCGNVFYDEDNIATPNSFQPQKGAYTDSYLVKLNSAGVREWGTYYGGSRNENCETVTTDSSGNIYMGGTTNSEDNYATPGAFQENIGSTGDYQDAFIVKFAPNGQRLWGTYYGGEKSDGLFFLGVSDDGYLYGLGNTSSHTNIATSDGIAQTTDGGDGMLIKFNLNGERVWGTYIDGGSSYAYFFFTTIKGNFIYTAGRTASTSGLATPGTFFSTYPPLEWGQTDNGFVMKIDLVTQQKVWGTYFPETINGLDVNDIGEVYISGSTSKDSGIATPDAFMPTKGFYLKGYLNKLNNTGQRAWGTYFGGERAEQLIYVKVDDLGDIYLYGTTWGSHTGITTPSNMIQSNAGMIGTQGTSAFLVKFRDCYAITATASNSPICENQQLELHASGGTNYSWTGPNGFTSLAQNPIIPNATALHSGHYFCTITGTVGCDNTNSVTVKVGDIVTPIPNVSQLPEVIGDCIVVVTSVPTATDNCSGSITATTLDPLTYDLPGDYTVVWKYDDGNGNTITQNQNITVNPNADLITPEITFEKCDDDNDEKQFFDLYTQQPAITSLPHYSFSYFRNESDALLQSNGIADPMHFENQTNPQTIYVRVLNTLNNCTSVSKIILTVNRKPMVSNVNLRLCDEKFNGIREFNLTLGNVTSETNVNLEYFESMTDLSDAIAIPNRNNYSNRYNGQKLFVKVIDANGCFSIAEVNLYVDPISQFTLTNLLQCDDDYDSVVTFDLSEKNSSILTQLPTDTYFFSYHTTLLDAASGDNPIPQQYTNSQNFERIFARVSGTTGCPIIFSFLLEVKEKPKLEMKDNWTICEGVPTPITADDGFDEYNWSTGSSGQQVMISQAGNYFVTATTHYSGISCSTTKNFVVIGSNAATISEVITTDWTDNENTITVLLSNSSIGNYEYSLDNIHFQLSNVFTGLISNDYTVYVKDINECGTVKQEVFIMMYPKYFTPNGDGVNDLWNVNFSKVEPNLSIKIFNRYGKLLKQLGNISGWDGTSNNTLLPSDDYWFIVTRENGKQYRGHFSLKR